MAGCIGLCLFIGYWLDRWFGTGGIFITIFIILGVIGGGVTVYREIDKFLDLSKKKDESDPEKKDNG